jgi:hypothetical protein
MKEIQEFKWVIDDKIQILIDLFRILEIGSI